MWLKDDGGDDDDDYAGEEAEEGGGAFISRAPKPICRANNNPLPRLAFHHRALILIMATHLASSSFASSSPPHLPLRWWRQQFIFFIPAHSRSLCVFLAAGKQTTDRPTDRLAAAAPTTATAIATATCLCLR